MVDGVLYNVAAVEHRHAPSTRRPASVLWTLRPQGADASAGATPAATSSTAASRSGRARSIVGTLDGRLIALDAKTGKPVWSVQTVDQAKPYTITGAPRVVRRQGAHRQRRRRARRARLRHGLRRRDRQAGLALLHRARRSRRKPDGAASDKVMAEGRARPGPASGGRPAAAARSGIRIAYDPELDLVYFGIGNGAPWNAALPQPRRRRQPVPRPRSSR